MTDTAEAILARGFWDKTVKIGKVQGKRHTAIFPERDGEPTRTTFCNFCGSSFVSARGGGCGCNEPKTP